MPLSTAVAATDADTGARILTPPDPLPPAVGDTVRDDAARVDRDLVDLRPLLRRLASHGLGDLGAPGSAGTLVDQARVIAALARSCMASAFTLWAHRMTVEYLAAGAATGALAGAVRTARRPGATAMAAAFRDVAGIAELPVSFRPTSGGFVLDGVVPWASNLYDDAIVVTAARHADTGERVVIALDASTPGLEITPARDLLALGSTRSGALRLHDVAADAGQIVTDDLVGFLRRIRPVFLVLQSAFCLGLAAAALDACPEPKGVLASFAPEHRERSADLDQLDGRLGDLASRAGTPEEPPVRAYLEVRLETGRLARAATELELCLTGGRGYVATSPTARRVREALFLPVQSPTEGHLRWELSRCA